MEVHRNMAVNRQYSLTEEQMDDVRNLFATFDKDGKGTLTKSEAEAAIRSRNENLSDDEMNLMMRMLDIGTSGEVTFDEFLKMAALCECGEELSEVQVKQLFRAFDIDGNGVLSADELKKIWNMASAGCAKHASDAEMDAMIKSIDINGDGQIDYDEFAKLMLSQ